MLSPPVRREPRLGNAVYIAARALSQTGGRLHIRTMPDLVTSSDGELVRAARTDPGAFDELFRRHAVGLESWFRARVPERETAADLVAETFAVALTAATRFRGVRPRSATSWLYGISRNLLRQYYRRNRVETAARHKLGIRTEDRISDAAEMVERDADAERLATTLRQAILSLPLDQRTAVELRILGQQSYNAVASQLECSNAAARMKVSRGLRRLHASMKGAEA
jgi:RNA polymerase sigma factor (sigma-70 family)